MKQYCRHCVFCIDSEPYYCTVKEQLMSEKQIKNINHCPEFALADDDVISGKPYSPREKYHKRTEQSEDQLSLNMEEN